MENQNVPDCCKPAARKDRGIVKGIAYGLIPHAGCIAFLLIAVLGITGANLFFAKYLFKTSVFYSLIALSFVFATVSAFIYVRRKQSTFRKEWKYLCVLYSTVLIVNLLMLFVVFPATASIALAQPIGQAVSGMQQMTLSVAIPCSGHASLIIYELKAIKGINDVKYVSGNFEVYYDPAQISKEDILKAGIFKEYPAKVLT